MPVGSAPRAFEFDAGGFVSLLNDLSEPSFRHGDPKVRGAAQRLEAQRLPRVSLLRDPCWPQPTARPMPAAVSCSASLGGVTHPYFVFDGSLDLQAERSVLEVQPLQILDEGGSDG